MAGNIADRWCLSGMVLAHMDGMEADSAGKADMLVAYTLALYLSAVSNSQRNTVEHEKTRVVAVEVTAEEAEGPVLRP